MTYKASRTRLRLAGVMALVGAMSLTGGMKLFLGGRREHSIRD